MYIPATPVVMTAGNRAAESDTPAAFSTQPWTVLCVDDEHDMLSLTKRFLKRAASSVSVVTETSPHAALDQLPTDQWDGVISDYRMPEMNGLEFRAELRKRHPELPFLLCTTDNNPIIEARVLDDPPRISRSNGATPRSATSSSPVSTPSSPAQRPTNHPSLHTFNE